MGPKKGPHTLTREILEYLLDNPDAKDTLEGITQWWVTKDPCGVRRKEVAEVLAALTTKGWIRKRPPVESLYSLNRERTFEIQEFLGKEDERNTTE